MADIKRFRKPRRPFHTNIVRYKQTRFTRDGKPVLVSRKREFKVPVERSLTREELVDLLNAARKDDPTAKKKLQGFYIKEVEFRLLPEKERNFPESPDIIEGTNQERKARFLWTDPEFFTDLAFRPALDEWLSQNKKFNLKKFATEIAPLVGKHVEEWKKLLNPKMGDLTQLEVVDRLLFSEFRYLRRRNESMEEFHQLFTIALHDYIVDTWRDRLTYQGRVYQTTRAKWEQRMRRSMDEWKDGRSRTLGVAKSLETPLARRTEEYRKDDLASKGDRQRRNLRIIFPMTHSHRELARRRTFVTMLWNQLKPTRGTSPRKNMLDEWEKGHRPSKIIIFHHDGNNSQFDNPSIPDLRKVYDTWIQNPGPIIIGWTVRWQKLK